MTHDLPTPAETRHTPERVEVKYERVSLKTWEPGDTYSVYTATFGPVSIECQTFDDGKTQGDFLRRCKRALDACASIPGDPGEVLERVIDGLSIALTNLDYRENRVGISEQDRHSAFICVRAALSALKGEGGGDRK